MRDAGEETTRDNKTSRRFSGPGFVTRRGNYESKINFVLHSALGLAREAPTAFTRWPKHTYLTHVCMAFIAFVTSCLPNSCKYVWIVRDGTWREGGERGGGRTNVPTRVHYTSLTFMNCSELFCPLSFLRVSSVCVSSRGFLFFFFFLFYFFRPSLLPPQLSAKTKFYRRRLRARTLTIRSPWIQIALEKSRIHQIRSLSSAIHHCSYKGQDCWSVTVSVLRTIWLWRASRSKATRSCCFGRTRKKIKGYSYSEYGLSHVYAAYALWWQVNLGLLVKVRSVAIMTMDSMRSYTAYCS